MRSDPISPQVRQKIDRMKKALRQNNSIIVQAPNITPVYFKNIRRGPLGQLRRALRESLPARSVLGLSFIGGPILEVLCDERLQHQFIATLRIAGIRHIPKFDIVNEGRKRTWRTETEK